MKPLLLAVLLAIMQTPSPVPRKATDSATGTSGRIQSQANSDKTPPSQSQPPVNASAAPSYNANGNEQGADNARHSISVSKLPPVTVVAPRRDWADWGYWVFSGLLVVVGGLQVWLLLRTLNAIQRQADLMQKHAEHLQNLSTAASDNAKAARENAEAFLNSERAWVLVKRIGNPEYWYAPEKLGYTPGMVFEFKVYGRTPARVIKAVFRLHPVPMKPGVKPPEPDLPPIPDYESGIRNPEIPEEGRVLPPEETFQIRLQLDPPTLTNEQWEKLRDGETIMCAYGFIEYTDAFGRIRETRTCYLYNFSWGFVIKAADGTILNPPGFRFAGGLRAYNKET